MASTAKQRARARWSENVYRWLGDNAYRRELEAQNRQVEKRKRRQYRHARTKEG